MLTAETTAEPRLRKEEAKGQDYSVKDAVFNHRAFLHWAETESDGRFDQHKLFTGGDVREKAKIQEKYK